MKKIFAVLISIVSFFIISTNLVSAAECASFTVSPLSGKPTDTYNISASGCPAGASYKLEVRRPDATLLTSLDVSADTTGNVSGFFAPSAQTVPPNGSSQYVVRLMNGFNVAAGPVQITISNVPAQVPSSSNEVQCENNTGINTAIGCIPFTDQNALVGFFLKWGLGIGGGIAFLLILFAGFQIMSSRGDPNRLKAGQELMTSAIAGLLLLIFSLVILRIIGVDILQIKGFI